MSDQFDAEIRRAVKESMGRTMQGLEFTPEMGRKVLERIRAEEGAPEGSAQRPFPRAMTRPLAWIAAAAAAFAMAMNMDGVELFQRQAKDSGAMESLTTANSPTAPPSQTLSDATGTSSSPGPAPSTPAPAEETVTFTAPGAGRSGTAESQREGEVPLELPLPAADTKDGQPKSAKPDPAVAHINKGKGPEMGIVAMDASHRLSLTAASSDRVVELRSDGVFAYGAHGEPLWERRFEGGEPTGRLRIAGDGSMAVSAGARVYLLGADGAVRSTVTVPEFVTDIALGPDGRLAVAYGRSVAVYQGEKQAYALDGVDGPAMTFGPDGSLAVLSFGEKHVLTRYDQTGKQTAKLELTGDFSPALAYEPATALVLAGRQAVDVTGRVAWQLPLVPQGAAPMGTGGLVVAWDAATIVGVKATDGQELWRALVPNTEGGIARVAVSADGARVAILAHTGQGPMLWVLDQQGKLVYSEQLETMPVDMALAGRVLVLQNGDGLQVRQLR